MYSYGFNQFGGPDVFTDLDLPEPDLKPGQMLVKVMAVGVTPYDALMREGKTQKDRPMNFPIVPGTDIVGTIVKQGSDADQFSIGEVVIGKANIGGYGEYVPVSQKRMVRKPEALPLAEAAALPTPGTVAYDIFFGATELPEDQMITVMGATGAVGSLTLQIAKQLGHRAQAVVSPRNTQRAQQLHADQVLTYDHALNIDELHRTNFLVNASRGADHLQMALDLLKPTGILLSLTHIPNSIRQAAPDITFIEMNDATYHQTGKALNYMVDLYGDGMLDIEVGETQPFSLAGVIEAHKDLDSGHHGKIILTND
ncbi:NADP-dependent oxidoreductase [Levilactobacillus bambusae]|uniref:Enoyl reductase (ER) domain-containing protein n=1 Tax=Levilactobacillus bambusae TaxID=2024736 RepID=A0A2V1N186_9LACO|nr:NADP-dependent oxidoreductase [Levilactobacillus bambusae]PWG01029.1 hypothetical protein DCM90_02315 [Levilactobacillus bambusae]